MAPSISYIVAVPTYVRGSQESVNQQRVSERAAPSSSVEQQPWGKGWEASGVKNKEGFRLKCRSVRPRKLATATSSPLFYPLCHSQAPYQLQPAAAPCCRGGLQVKYEALAAAWLLVPDCPDQSGLTLPRPAVARHRNAVKGRPWGRAGPADVWLTIR